MQRIQDFNLLDVDFSKKKQDSIQELIKDPMIQEVMMELKMTPKGVENYWIEFLDYQEDHQKCKNCKGLQQCSKTNVGLCRKLEMIDQNLHTNLVPCKYGKKHFEDINILNNIILKYVDESLLLDRNQEIGELIEENPHVAEILTRLTNYAQNPDKKGFYLYGKLGVGKTTLMGSFVRMLAKYNYTCGIVHFQTFLTELKGSFNEAGSNDAMRMMRNVDYLVIDDIGNENITSWSRDEILYSVLAYRFQNQKPTFFTSDYSLKELKVIYADGKKSNIRGNRLISLIETSTEVLELKS